MADSVGRMVWSLAEEGEEQKRGGVEEKTIYSTFSTFHKIITMYRFYGNCTVYSRRDKPVATTATVHVEYSTKCCLHNTWYSSIVVIQSILFKGVAVRQLVKTPPTLPCFVL